MWAAIAQGAATLGTQLLNYQHNRNQQRREFRHNRQQSEMAYAHDLDMWNRQSNWNLDMWHLQNQFNLPENQMARLRAAGLNPNLVATGGASGGSAGSIQSAQMPRYSPARANYSALPINAPDILGLYNNFRLANAQIDQVKAHTDLTQEKTLTEAVNRSMTAARRSRVLAENPYYYELSKYSQQLAELSVKKRQQELTNSILDAQIKTPMVGRTQAEAGLKQMEYQFFRNLGIKGMRDIAPFLQLLLQSFRR